MNRAAIKEWVRLHRYALLFFVLLYVTLLAVSPLFPIEFADAYNASVAHTLIETGQYTPYIGDEFDVLLSTGPAVILPVAVSFLVFGVNVLAIRIVMVGFFVGLCAAVYVLVHKYTESVLKSLIAVGVFLITFLRINAVGPDSVFNLLGQLPGFFFLLFAFVLFVHATKDASPKRLLTALAGISIGLAVQSKLFFIFGGIGYGVIFLVHYWKSIPPKKIVEHAAVFAGGAALPTVLFLLWQFLALGREQFLLNQFGLYKTISFTPERLANLSTMEIFGNHLETLQTIISLPHFLIVLLLSVPLGFFFRAFKQRETALVYLSVFYFCYGAWWMFTDTLNVLRHTIYLLLSLVLILLFTMASSYTARWQRVAAGCTLAIIVLFGLPAHSVFADAMDLRRDQQELITHLEETQDFGPITFTGLDLPTDIALIMQRDTQNSVHQLFGDTQLYHQHIFTPISQQASRFVFNVLRDNQCIDGFTFQNDSYSVCDTWGNAYSQEELAVVQQNADTICTELREGQIGKCSKQLRNGYVVTRSPFLTLGNDFATWIRVQPKSSTLLIAVEVPDGIAEQHLAIFVNDDRIDSYIVEHGDRATLEIPVTEYADSLIKLRIQSDQIVSPLYSTAYEGIHYDYRSLHLFNIIQQ